MRHALIFASAALVFAAAGCQTTGTGTASAAPMLQVSQPDDAVMDCDQLRSEIARMDQLMGAAVQQAANAEASGRTANVATGAAINAGLYSGALGRVPGLGAAAHAAGNLAQQNAAAEAERKQEEARRAELRRTSLSGVYAGKGCAA